MTTIVVDRKNLVMAADRQSLMGGTYKFRSTPKITRMEGMGYEWLVASAGCAEAGQFFELWFYEFLRDSGKETTNDLLYPKDGEFSAFTLRSDGSLFLYLNRGCGISIHERYAALGSGGDYALGALYSGATVQRAIQISTSLDAGTGKGIQIETLDPGRRNKKKIRS
jgi:ATP-dependent protease HslVU (ClpYQ) peptidase subunit